MITFWRGAMIIKPLNAQEFGKDIAESYPKVEKIQHMLKEQ